MKPSVCKRVKSINKQTKFTQKVKQREILKLNIQEKLEDFSSTIKRIFSKNKQSSPTYREVGYNNLCLDYYDSYITFADLCLERNLSGIDTSIDSKTIHTEFGPIIITPLTILENMNPEQDSHFTFEGFAPDDDNLLKYFNCQIAIYNPQKPIHILNPNEFQLTPGIAIFHGFTVDPESQKLTPLDKITPLNNKLLFYIRKQEEIATRKDQEFQNEK